MPKPSTTQVTCVALNGTLAAPTTDAQANSLRLTITGEWTGNRDNNHWVGCSDRLAEGTFVTVGGAATPCGSTSAVGSQYHANEPNNFSAFGGEDCVFMRDQYGRNGAWDDGPCAWVMKSFCQRPKPATSDITATATTTTAARTNVRGEGGEARWLFYDDFESTPLGMAAVGWINREGFASMSVELDDAAAPSAPMPPTQNRVHSRVLQAHQCVSSGNIFSVATVACTTAAPCSVSFYAKAAGETQLWQGFSTDFPGAHTWTVAPG
jgi:hypothetical protein